MKWENLTWYVNPNIDDGDDDTFQSDLNFDETNLVYAIDNNLIHDIRSSWASADLKAAYQAVGSDKNWPERRQSWPRHTP